jgi:hypothetical protein
VYGTPVAREVARLHLKESVFAAAVFATISETEIAIT